MAFAAKQPAWPYAPHRIPPETLAVILGTYYSGKGVFAQTLKIRFAPSTVDSSSPSFTLEVQTLLWARMAFWL